MVVLQIYVVVKVEPHVEQSNLMTQRSKHKKARLSVRISMHMIE